VEDEREKVGERIARKIRTKWKMTVAVKSRSRDCVEKWPR
jgi:hypothetical protein